MRSYAALYVIKCTHYTIDDTERFYCENNTLANVYKRVIGNKNLKTFFFC